MNIFKKLFNTEYLSSMTEFDRNSEGGKLNTFTYSSDAVIKDLERDIRSGKGIEKPIDFMIHKGKGLVTEGCHRTAAGKNAGLLNIPFRIIFKGRLTGDLKKRENKFKTL